MKPHQINALFFIGGFIIGAVLHYTLYSKTVAYKVDEAYEIGIEEGIRREEFRTSTSTSPVTPMTSVTRTDSVYMISTEIKFYYK